MGQLEYSAQSNDSGSCVDAQDRDDMELINLITCGIASYTFRNHVASDIAINQKFLPSENCKSQNQLDSVQQWTDDKIMRLNKEKEK